MKIAYQFALQGKFVVIDQDRVLEEVPVQGQAQYGVGLVDGEESPDALSRMLEGLKAHAASLEAKYAS